MKQFILTFILMTFTVNIYSQTPEDVTDLNSIFYDEDADPDLKSDYLGKSWSRNGIQYGAFLNPVSASVISGGDYLSTAILNTKLWVKSYMWTNSYLYIRLTDSAIAIAAADGMYSSLSNQNVFDLDLAFISAANAKGSFEFSTGRKYFNVGSGVVFDGRADGAEAALHTSIIDFLLFTAYSGLLYKENNPYALNDTDEADGSKRLFSAGELTFNYYNQSIYTFGMAQFDFSEQDDQNKTEYNSQYYGLGVKGVAIQYLSYFSEFIYERGTSYITSTQEKANINAFAFNSGANYFFQSKMNPILIFQYAMGSGDSDRGNYVSSNRSISTKDDTGFVYFGTFNGGYALKPRLSNIHVIRTGFSFSLFSGSKTRSLQNFSLTGKYGYYLKMKKDSTINNGDAPEADYNVGQEVDLSLKWKLLYDLSYYINYGLFIPGAAYGDNDNVNNYITTGVNLTF
ncbi:MAG: alginate export family protein [Spirochaetes bacterium]|nr:alginate export family protein [Spirochaetota bacterium]